MIDTRPRSVAEGWATAYRRLASRLAHEIRNPLNGVVVNLEVLRERTAGGSVAADALQPFARAAATEMERTVALVEALLALARPAPAPVDLAGALRPLVLVLDAIAVRGGGGVVLETTADTVAAPVDADGARFALVQATEGSLDDGARLRCSVRSGREGAELHVSGARVPPFTRFDELPNDLTIYVSVTGGDVLIRFPRLGAT